MKAKIIKRGPETTVTLGGYVRLIIDDHGKGLHVRMSTGLPVEFTEARALVHAYVHAFEIALTAEDSVSEVEVMS